jgi:CDP-abequose synthase
MSLDKIKNVVVTGGTGFIGTCLIKKLLEDGYHVVQLIRGDFPSDNASKDEFLTYLTLKKIEDFAKNNNVYAFIHLATNYGNNSNLSDLVQCNIEAPLKLLELSLNANCNLFLNTDSFFCKSNNEYTYMRPYVYSKKSFTYLSKIFCEKNPNMRFLNLRLEHVYGPEDRSNKFVSQLVGKLKKNEKIDMTYGLQERDFIYVEDVAEAYIAILKKYEDIALGFSEFELGTGKSTTIKEFAELLRDLIKSRSELNFGALPYREGEMMKSVADVRPLSELGWTAKIELESGLSKMLHESENN